MRRRIGTSYIKMETNKSHLTLRRLEELSSVSDVRLDICVLCAMFHQCMQHYG